MTVFVDPAIHACGRMIMCHMWADTPGELHAMARRLGLRREWFQCPPKASWEHYDVSKAKRAAALAFGAVATDIYGPTEFLARREGDAAWVATIAACRARRAAWAASPQGVLL